MADSGILSWLSCIAKKQKNRKRKTPMASILSCKILVGTVVVVVQFSKFPNVEQEACDGGSGFFFLI